MSEKVGDHEQMKRLTKKLRAQLPRLGATAEVEDPTVICKFFTPDGHWTWYGIEFDGEDIFYGFVDGDFPEFGTFRLSELKQIRGALGLPIERDRFFVPCPASQIQAQCKDR